MTGRVRLVGTLLALLSASSFGVLPVLTKIVYADGVGSLGVLAVRFPVASAVLLLLGRLRRETWRPAVVVRRLLLLGGAGYAVEAACSRRCSGSAPVSPRCCCTSTPRWSSCCRRCCCASDRARSPCCAWPSRRSGPR